MDYKNNGEIPADSDIEAIIKEMKPWYDNYCFSENALDTQSRVFNCDMVLCYLRNYMSKGRGPKEMIDPNTKTDYNKMKKLLQLDKLDGNRKGVMFYYGIWIPTNLPTIIMIWRMMANGEKGCSLWQMLMPRFRRFVMASRQSAICKVSSWHILISIPLLYSSRTGAGTWLL